MFTNLWNSSSQAFRDFNLFQIIPGQTDIASEADIISTMHTERKIGSRATLHQVLPSTFSTTASDSFFRQNPNVVATATDFFLSKFYQYVILSIRIICEEPVTDESIALTFPLYRDLEFELANLPDELTTPEVLRRFEFAVFQDDLESSEQEYLALRGVVASIQDRLEIAFGRQPGSSESRRKERERDLRIKFRSILFARYRRLAPHRGAVQDIYLRADVDRQVLEAWKRGEYAEETETSKEIQRALNELIREYVERREV